MLPFARAAVEAGAGALAVLEVQAALELRAEGVTVPLFAWLHGERTDFAAAIAADIELGVSSLAELHRILDAVSNTPAAVHLKVDTGLHRNGASPEDWPALVGAAREAEDGWAAAHRGPLVAPGRRHHPRTTPRLAEFQAAVAVAAGSRRRRAIPASRRSSAGIREPETRFAQVRFGIAAYGISPFDDVDGRGLGLRPVMTYRARCSP
jgi:alanine racemase